MRRSVCAALVLIVLFCVSGCKNINKSNAEIEADHFSAFESPLYNTPSRQDKTDNFEIDNLDKLNFYAAKQAFIDNNTTLPSKASQKPTLMNTTKANRFMMLNVANTSTKEINKDFVFTITMYSCFNITLNDANGFLTRKLGGTGTVEVVITCNNFNNMITFKKDGRYYSCFQSDSTENTMVFSTHKYVQGFKLIENYDQENYEFVVRIDDDRVVGTNCVRSKGDNTNYHFTPDNITFKDDFSYVIHITQSYTAHQLESLFAFNNSFVDEGGAGTTDVFRQTDTSRQTTVSRKTETTSSSVESNVNKHTHKYTQSVKAATCGSQGYTEYRCDCGDSYKSNYTAATYKHNFNMTKKVFEGITYDTTLCTNCGIEVFSHGNADNSYAGGNDKVKYYVTGKTAVVNGNLLRSDYHVVVYGEGPMTEIGRNGKPGWHKFLSGTKQITIADGITTICRNAFNYPDGRTRITFNMADSVKIIKDDAINLNMRSITLGKGVEYIEDDIKGKNMAAIYLPKTLKYFGRLGNAWDNHTIIFYEGTKEEFLNIQTERLCHTVTIEDILEQYYSSEVYSPYCYVFLECTKLFDETNYFDMMSEWS